MLKITAEVLRGWDACPEGYKRFNQLFPDGADLKTAADALHDDGHTDWSIWLFGHCRKDERFRDQSVDGFHNTGHQNTGHQNTGDWNTGHQNTGHQNTGDWNTGDKNTGDWNTGHQNTGDKNTGNWNTGDWNTGNFNTITPVDILVFNRPIPRQTWDQAAKPSFIFNLVTTWWVDESEMTDEEKAADPESVNRGGQLRIRTSKDAWRKAWNETTDADRRLVLSLPNFDPDVFLAISGIDVRTEL